MTKLLAMIVLFLVVAFAGAAAQSYSRLNTGPTFVDSIVKSVLGREDSFENLGRKTDRLLDKARDAVKELDEDTKK